MKKTKQKQLPKMQLSYMNSFWQLVVAALLTLIIMSPRQGLTNAFQTKWFYPPLLITFSSCIFLVAIIERVSMHLDKVYRLEEKLFKRLLYQGIFGWALPLTACFLYAELLFSFLNINVTSTFYSRHIIQMILSHVALLNVGYMMYYSFYFLRRGHKIERVKTGTSYSDHLIFTQKDGDVKINTGDIAYFCVRGKNALITLHQGEPIILWRASLEEIAHRLNPKCFFKVNRSYIISKKSYKGHRKGQRGSIQLRLEPEVKEPVKVSKTNADSILDWIKPGVS